MCFSATASIASGTLLFGVGVASLSKVFRRSQFMLACVPILFSFQQFFESALWNCLGGSTNTSCIQNNKIIFVIIGQSFWPIWMPLSIWMVEENAYRKKILAVITSVGIAVSAYYFYYTSIYGLEVKIIDHHIAYELTYPSSYMSEIKWFYLVPAVVSNFISSSKKIQGLGLLLLLALIVTQIFFFKSALSVWCFLAAIISIYIYVILKSEYFLAGNERIAV